MHYYLRLTLLLLAASLFGADVANADSLEDLLGVVQPAAPGRYPVGCSNIEQDFSRASGNPAGYWEGSSGSVVDLLVDPADSFVTNVSLPDDGQLYGDFRGRSLSFGTLVCYPTSSANGYADYALPNGEVVPHMQRGAQPPLFADDRERYPLLLFSHGLGGSPVSSDYIDAIALFASQGYVVVAPFHADARITDIQIDNLGDIVTALLNLPNYTAMQAIRPQTLHAALDTVLANPDFAARIDASRIGGFGASLGGESLLLMRGARLTISPDLSSKTVLDDTRLNAAVGYVPYFGQPFLPAFGRDEEGLEGVTLPYLAIAGGADTTAPAATTALGMSRLAGVRQFVLLAGVGHGFDPRSSADIFTWSLTFLGAYVDDDPIARATSARMTKVAGGGDDFLLLQRSQPLPPQPGERSVVEYYNASIDHYFMTADPAEAAMLDEGIRVPGWQRTGYAFNAYAPDAQAGLPACRFYGTPGIGPDSHFFTILDIECAAVRNDPGWLYEGTAFRIDSPDVAGTCAVDRVPVIRMFNNRKGGQVNHRYLTSWSEIDVMLQQGWIIEQPVFCALP